MGGIRENVAEVRERIARAARKVGRQPEEITLIAVTKNVPVERIKEAVDAGIKELGENRVQELLEKQAGLAEEDISWHLIGHLQRNKVKYVWNRVRLIHSLDSLQLARELEKRAAPAGERIKVLVEVNVAGESSKFGLPVEAVPGFLKELTGFKSLEVLGLMTVAPFVNDPEEVRPVFRRLRELAGEIEALALPGVEMRYLSMGMTNDFEVAVEEGSNMVRIGTAIFGPRQ
ncbi:YggS family pyridoxal phosphate-dependent enzyme [Thermanaeromonas sp. C210]|uniref:YggS family pyridoxal phosphate-dependent enzyme n=1 Tax=Thermanaeromonas sp. C210 TaxID=2731925 RepID=UPI00155D267D|nr:YggS family pyridoxal phosphate-dependent enzyme [Thermanaeromonas sp. C210]GFN24060.1 YggS family pyridoxal phosphate enzyme [Thermanaeromonas sp. C210]